ncbi:major facilitator superfamily domain-containing protein [Zychaea mexicana]|uniref:major facilitator superfamily domain-containing protein n=1 Tax=Zychaea mexicana TaxID=64656 RepID=UPI0022FEE56C|nr:major facilitator superfamily domain-containing protein [Zychaea mexicana]KAI9477134.1 major facilitator superfamily domain-containing protein [Zychaea mexicana]
MYVLCKLLYITVFALLSAAQSYLPLYYHDVIKFSSDQIGFVIAIAPCIQSIACPIWTYLADKRPKLHGITMALTSFVGGIAVMGIMGVGHYVQNNSQQEETTLRSISTSSDGNGNNGNVMLLICAFAIAFAFFSLPNTSMVDSAVMKILGPNKILYGEQRLWGSISTGLTILAVGMLISATNNLDSLFWVFAGSTVCFMVCSAFVNVQAPTGGPVLPPRDEEETSRLVPPNTDTTYYVDLRKELSQHDVDTDDDEDEASYLTAPHYNQRLLKLTTTTSMARTLREEANDAIDSISGLNLGLAVSRVMSVEHAMTGILEESASIQAPSGSMFKSVRVMTFLATTLLFGLVLSICINFLFIFFNQSLHMPASWMGWTGPIGAITELLCFCFAKQMTELWGVTNLIIGAHVVTIIRCIAYTLLVPDSVFSHCAGLLLQTMHGIGFAVFWATAVSEMDSLFPPEQRAVAQGLLGGLNQGLGMGLGALIGGYIDAYLGTIWMFRSAALLCVLSAVIFCIGRLPRFET